MKKLIIDYRQFTHLVSKICCEISLGNWKPEYVVGITRGGLLPAVMISHYLNIPCHTIKVSLRDGDGFCDKDSWIGYDAINSKNVLVVDDINDTGATINWLINDWGMNRKWRPTNSVGMRNNWQDNLKFAVIVDNLASNCSVKMDFSGMEIDKNQDPVWVDFPYEEWWIK